MQHVMSKNEIIYGIRKLNVSERLNIITDIWDEIKDAREPLIHHQNTTCGVSCGSIPLRRMPNTTPGAAALLPCIWHPAGDQEISERD